MWTKAKEKELFELSDLLTRLRITRSKIFIKKQQDVLDKQIADTEVRVNKLSEEKDGLVGLTAENYASKKMNEYYIWLTLYRDQQLREKFFKESDFEEIENDAIIKLFKLHKEYSEKFSTKTLQYIAFSSFFMNLFMICDDNPYVFYGKPVVHLTFYQVKIFEYAKTLKNILTNTEEKVPQEVLNNPDKITDWYESFTNAKQVINKRGKKRDDDDGFTATSLVGASKDDLKRLGMDQGHDQNKLLTELAKKKGGALNIEDMIKFHNA